jgi:hypothetical protein
MASTGTLGFGGDSHPFRDSPQSDSPSPTGRKLGRSPRIRTRIVSAQPPHLPYLPYPVGFVIWCRLAWRLGLLCDFCRSARTFALGLPSDHPSRGYPCPRLVVAFVLQYYNRDIIGTPTGDCYPISSCPCRGTQWFQRTVLPCGLGPLLSRGLRRMSDHSKQWYQPLEA